MTDTEPSPADRLIEFGGALPSATSDQSAPAAIAKVAIRIGDVDERHRRAMAAHMALIERYMAMLVDVGLQAQQQRDARSLTIFERDFDKMAELVPALVDGNYLDTACSLADVAYSGVRAWVKAADEGDTRYQVVGRLIRAAEAVAESEAVGMIRSAGKDPRLWCAPATWLERRYPHKYGRRQEENDTARVVVQIGVRDSDVSVNVAPAVTGALGTQPCSRRPEIDQC